MGRLSNNGISLFRRIAIPLVAIVIGLCVVFLVATVRGGVLTTVDDNSRSVLSERISSKRADIESMFSDRWTDMDSTIKAVNNKYDDVTAAGTSLQSDDVAQRAFLENTYSDVVSMLRSNIVSGVFLILNNGGVSADSMDATSSPYGVCVRDYDPDSSYIDREDLLVTRCPSSMVSNLGSSIESEWEARFNFGDSDSGDYYFKPLELAFKNPGVPYDSLAYFDPVHSLGDGSRQVVSYSVPLIGDDGTPYGVLGIELTVDYLESLLPGPTLFGTTDACYILATNEDGSDAYSVLAHQGVLYDQVITGDQINVQQMEDDLISCEPKDGVELQGYASPITIYNNNTPFSTTHLSLVGLVKPDALYQVSSMIRSRFILISLIVLALGVLVAFLVSRRIVKPINELATKVRTADDAVQSDLGHVGITEIDDLVASIEDLGEKVNRSEVRTEFFSRMSHDMRTPMNAVIGFSSPELTDGASNEVLHEYMEKIHSSGTYLLGLINEVLDIAKIEFRNTDLEVAPVCGADVWDDVNDMISELAKIRGVNFVSNIDRAPVWFTTDGLHLTQVLMNLLSNAVKFTPADGTVRYEVTRSSVNPGHVSYRIVVADTGRGMSQDFIQRMYEPFMQETPGDGGTGLGLSITKQIIDLMGGTITCDSVLGKGTTFTVDLTFDTCAAPAADERAQAASAAPASTTSVNVLDGRRVLLCEDNALNAQIALNLLERRGMTVDLASDGRIGVDTFSASAPNTYDIVLMDIRMPNMGGLEAAATIRALDRADATTVPIVAMTANAFAEDMESSRAAGMNEHLSKPVDPDVLYATLERLLSSGPAARVGAK